MMEESIAGKRKEIEGIRLMKEKVERLMGDLGNLGTANVDPVDGVHKERETEKRRHERQRAAWDALEEELGSD